MKLSKSVAELQREHVVLELECIDRMYLNAYVPQLTSKLAEEIGKKALNVWIECTPKPTNKVTSCGEIIC